WTPSWTLFSGGGCFILLAVFYAVIDAGGLAGWSFPLRVIGANSIAAYLFAHGPARSIPKSFHIYFCPKCFRPFGAASEPPGAGALGLPLDPEQAANGLQLPPGFRAQVFAAEPDVQNPVAMTWDNRGRLWVAECYTYANRPTRFDLALRDRVVIFNDRDGDGR